MGHGRRKIQFLRAGNSITSAQSLLEISVGLPSVLEEFFHSTHSNNKRPRAVKRVQFRGRLRAMEKMWRKFSAGQPSSSSASKKVPHTETGTNSSAGGFGFGEPANVAAVSARRRLSPDDSSVHNMIGIEKRRRRRRKSRPKRNG